MSNSQTFEKNLQERHKKEPLFKINEIKVLSLHLKNHHTFQRLHDK